MQIILHCPDQGDGEYAMDPAYGKSMSYRLLNITLIIMNSLIQQIYAISEMEVIGP